MLTSINKKFCTRKTNLLVIKDICTKNLLPRFNSVTPRNSKFENRRMDNEARAAPERIRVRECLNFDKERKMGWACGANISDSAKQ